jgi:hypothetical protein
VKYKALIVQILFVVFSLPLLTGVVRAQTPAPAEDIRDNLSKICDYAGTGQGKTDCTDCASNNGVWTALGCIPTTPQAVFTTTFTFGIGIAGGIAFLLILFGGFQVLTSAGNPEQLNAGQELISSAVAGLLLIIFSIFLLRLIGYDILRIPGFKP